MSERNGFGVDQSLRVELCEWYLKNILLQSLNNGTLIQSAHEIHQDGDCEREPALNGRD
jgi:hypothetical protein